jgi:hypothetical protein
MCLLNGQRCRATLFGANILFFPFYYLCDRERKKKKREKEMGLFVGRRRRPRKNSFFRFFWIRVWRGAVEDEQWFLVRKKTDILEKWTLYESESEGG